MCRPHDSSPTIPRRLAAALLVVALAGCSRGPGSPHPVDPDLARTTLKEVLQSWKEGKSPESWRKHDPEVVVQDLDWSGGKSLEEFEVLDSGEAIDANLKCPVRLTLEDSQGARSERTVTYIVSTSPVRTVFREIIP